MGGGEGRHDSRGNGLSGVASRILRSEVNVGFWSAGFSSMQAESSIWYSTSEVIFC